MKITVLGSGGWLPLEKKTSCFLIEHKGKLIILDAGSGILNLSQVIETISEYHEIHLILSHYHLDHIMGLTYLDLFIKSGQKMKIYAPGKPFYEDGPKEIIGRFMNPPYTPTVANQSFVNAEVIEYSTKSFFIDDILICPRVQTHTNYSFSIDIDQQMLYKTDTEFDLDSHLEKENNYDYIFIDCWGYFDKKGTGHTYFRQFERVKERINRKTKLILIHTNPLLSDEENNLIMQGLEEFNAVFAEDMQTFTNKRGII